MTEILKPSKLIAMKTPIFLIAGILPILLGISAGDSMAQESSAGTETFAPLFDGKSFDGWEGDTENTWRVVDGCLTAGSLDKPASRNEFLSTKKKYGDFELRLKFKITGGKNVNAGVQFRTSRIPDHHEVIGYQADIGPGWYGKLYDESRRKKVIGDTDEETSRLALSAVADDEWHTYRIRAVGPHIQLWLNGVKTVDYIEQDDSIDRDGIIAIQIHGGMQAIIAYKDIRILELLPINEQAHRRYCMPGD